MVFFMTISFQISVMLIFKLRAFVFERNGTGNTFAVGVTFVQCREITVKLKEVVSPGSFIFSIFQTAANFKRFFSCLKVTNTKLMFLLINQQVFLFTRTVVYLCFPSLQHRIFSQIFPFSITPIRNFFQNFSGYQKHPSDFCNIFMINANMVFLLKDLFFLCPIYRSGKSSCIFSSFDFAWVKEIPVLETTLKNS